MAEAEEVIQDVARHATIFARDLWRKHRPSPPGPAQTALKDVAERLDLLLIATFGRSFPLHVAEPPAPATFLTKVFRRDEGPRVNHALPATDGEAIWLPAMVVDSPSLTGLEQYRVMALQQAMRAARGSADEWSMLEGPVPMGLFLLYEAQCADAHLVQLLPGMAATLQRFRQRVLAHRPSIDLLPLHRQPIERVARHLLTSDLREVQAWPVEQVIERARHDAQGMAPVQGRRLLFRDAWTGEFRSPPSFSPSLQTRGISPVDTNQVTRSAHLPRSPKVREASEGEDDKKPGAWMVQTSTPHEQVEDPLGLERPTDRDESAAAEELADALSELQQARLVSTPGHAKEVLLSDQPPAARAKHAESSSPEHSALQQGARLAYPEWDYRTHAYIEGGVTVHLQAAAEGSQRWVEQTRDTHRAMLNLVRRRFEMLKAQRLRLRNQIDGDDIDLEACIHAYADFHAGQPMPHGLYQLHRAQRRDTAILILVDVSGSTDGWVSANKRIVDVEREALLLVAIALQGMAEPYALQAFSGQGPNGVVIRDIKRFADPYSDAVARRIASLEPEHYTRAGAAVRHATSTLMREAARHRLLLVLSDGKPNDIDDYEGRYGVEDMRQAVTEARLQGVHPFCLTVDRQAPGYLPGIFGAHRYALLPKPELLPTALLQWMKRLMLS